MLRPLIAALLAGNTAVLAAPAPREGGPRTAFVRTLASTHDDTCASIAVAGTGFYLAGYTSRGQDADDALVVRVDAGGGETWRRAVPGGSDAALWSVAALPDGGAIAAGWMRSARGDRDALIVRLDAEGAIAWQHAYGTERDERLWSLDLGADGLVAAGESVAAGRSTGLVIAVSLDGTERSLRTPGVAESERVFAVSALPDGGYVLAGLAGSGPRESAGYDARIARYDAGGKLTWSRPHGGADFDVAHAVALVSDGRIAVTGYSFTGPSRAADPFLLLLSSAGVVEWTRTYPGDDDERAVDLQPLPGGGFAIAGYSRAPGGDADMVVRATDARGAPSWVRRFGGAGDELGRALVVTPEGAVVAAGHSRSYDPHERILLLRLEAIAG